MTFLSASKRVAPSIALFFSVSLAVLDCGPQNGDPYPDVESFCYGRAKAECSAEVVKACAVVDGTRCISKRQAGCLATTPPAATYRPSGAESCIRSVSTAFADAKLTAEENRSASAVCALVFEGPGTTGGACLTDLDCKTSAALRCVRTGGTASGTCQIPERVQGGGLCASPRQLCIDGFHCGATQHCDINSQVGEPCGDVLPCAPTAQCSATGICVKKFDDGTQCTRDQDCLHDLCARGTGASIGLCVSQMTLAPNEPFCIDAR